MLAQPTAGLDEAAAFPPGGPRRRRVETVGRDPRQAEKGRALGRPRLVPREPAAAGPPVGFLAPFQVPVHPDARGCKAAVGARLGSWPTGRRPQWFRAPPPHTPTGVR